MFVKSLDDVKAFDDVRAFDDVKAFDDVRSFYLMTNEIFVTDLSKNAAETCFDIFIIAKTACSLHRFIVAKTK